MAEKHPLRTGEEVAGVCAGEAPFMQVYRFVPEHIGHGVARIRLAFDRHHVRPGDTLGGPALMALAAFTLYAVVLGMAGPGAVAAVTSSLTAHFLNKPAVADVICEGRILKLGPHLSTGEMTLWSEGE